ncbi:MAG: hypothetical protein RR506_08845 [Akkermansia sp.]
MKNIVIFILLCFFCSIARSTDLSDEAIRERLNKRASAMTLALHELQFEKTIKIARNINNSSDNNIELNLDTVSKINHDNGIDLLVCKTESIRSLHDLTFSIFKPSLGKVYRYDANALLNSFFDSQAAATNNNPRYIKALMIFGSLIGFNMTNNDYDGTNGTTYMGPYWPCVMDVTDHVTTNPSGIPNNDIFEDFTNDLLYCLIYRESNFFSDFPKGRYKKNMNEITIEFDYEIEMIWKDAIPSEIRIKFDLAPMRDRLFRVIKNKIQD